YVRAQNATPGVVSLRRDVAVVLVEVGVDADALRAAVGRAGEQEVVGLGEHREGRIAFRVGRLHVHQLHLGLVGQEVVDPLIHVGVGVGRGDRAGGPLQAPGVARGLVWVAVDVDVRRRVAVRGGVRGGGGLRSDEALQVA